MKKTLLSIIAIMASINTASAIDNHTVEIVYNGTSATVTIADDIKDSITNNSTNAHVRLVQNSGVSTEITYVLSGASDDGEFYMSGSYKATLSLAGVTLNNPSGPAINIQDGKRIKVSIKRETTNTLSDGTNESYKGCFHCKGHTEFKGYGTLNVVGNYKHAIYSKEYVQVKNCTINVTSAVKDGINCQEYLLLESGAVNIEGFGGDGIEVGLNGLTSTGETTGHEDEDTGNLYQTDGALTIVMPNSNTTGQYLNLKGADSQTGGTRNFTTPAGIGSIQMDGTDTETRVYDLGGRQTAVSSSLTKGVYVVKSGADIKKILVK